MSETLATLVSIEHEIRQQKNTKELAFFISHQSHLFFQYNKAIVFSCYQSKQIHIESVSNVVELDQYSPFQQKLLKLVKKLITKEKKFINHNFYNYSIEKLEKELNANLPDTIGPELLIYPFHEDGILIGGVIFSINGKPNEQKLKQLNYLFSAYKQGYCYLYNKEKHFRPFFHMVKKKRFFSLLFISILVLMFLIRVPLTVVADAVVVAKDPRIITAPMAGVVDKILVKSSQNVKKNEPIVKMDTEDLESALEQAKEELSVAKAKLIRAHQTGFNQIEKRSEIRVLQAQVKAEELKVSYNTYLLKKATILSPTAGTAIIDEPEDWTGKPVQVGEKIMEIAKPNEVEVKIYLPISDALSFPKDAKVKLFLTSNPLNTINAKVLYTSFEAEKSPKDILAYTVTAKMLPKQTLPRIGSQGTAKLYKEKTSLFFYIFRRPFTYLRQTFGW